MVKCKGRGYQYTRSQPRGRPLKDQVLAVVCFLSGLSMKATAAIVGVPAKTILYVAERVLPPLCGNEAAFL